SCPQLLVYLVSALHRNRPIVCKRKLVLWLLTNDPYPLTRVLLARVDRVSVLKPPPVPQCNDGGLNRQATRAVPFFSHDEGRAAGWTGRGWVWQQQGARRGWGWSRLVVGRGRRSVGALGGAGVEETAADGTGATTWQRWWQSRGLAGGSRKPQQIQS
ncbi:hypothetical protein BC830DRAFT_1208409, partial [Chytriomyces sp. MP71]